MNALRAVAKLTVLAGCGICCGIWCGIALSAPFENSAAAANNDWLIVPGQRVGPITPRTTRADLVRIFGAKNVQDDEIEITDGDRESGTKLFADQPTSGLAILWKDDAPDSHIRRIIFCDASEPLTSCKWHTSKASCSAPSEIARESEWAQVQAQWLRLGLRRIDHLLGRRPLGTFRRCVRQTDHQARSASGTSY